MKALRLPRADRTVCVGETLGGGSRERRRSRWNISRSMPTSITPWPRWRGRTGGWCATTPGHERGAFRQFLARCEPGSPVALETVGNWYWIVDDIEGAGCIPKLVHARKAKLMMGQINKTDKLDARGLNTLQRNGTLPTVWIPPGQLRDQRELPRTRMTLVRQRT
jgi:hypothetical protein